MIMIDKIVLKTGLLCVITGIITSSRGNDAAPPTFSANVLDDDNTIIKVSKDVWLKTVPPYFTVNGIRYSSGDGSLKKINQSTGTGEDKHGQWKSTDIRYKAGSVRIHTSVKQYLNVSMVIFEQIFPDGANDTSIGAPNKALSGFPRFAVGGQPPGLELGYLNYGGMFAGDTTKWMDRWIPLALNLRDGIPGGPISLFDRSDNVLIVSAFNNFMAAVMQHDITCNGGVISYGIMGSVKNIPAGFVLKTVVHYGNEGINQAFEGWGSTLRKEYGRDGKLVKSDLAVNYLGYWTDNGAYYYYLTHKNKTYDETIFDVQKYARKANIPYRYVQYDSWWYSMGPLGGVTKWEGRPVIFPKGMEYVYNKTGWPVVAHNRWWSSKTPYSKINGGKFNFLSEKLKSVPMEIDFWMWLFKKSKKWGLITYEQDWLDAQLLGVEGLLTDVDSARTWLVLMGKAAQKSGLTVQYCMSFPRHTLMALEIPSVTQIRVSDDYAPGKDDWKIGISSMFAYALRIAPYKDTFWTTTVQPGNPYGNTSTEPNNKLHALASVLSTGPVGPGDAIDKTNVSLLMRCCNAEGLILKPDKPVTAIDDQIHYNAFRDGSGAPGEVWSTYSVVSGWTFGIIVAAAMQPGESYNITPTSAGYRSNFPQSKIYADGVRTANNAYSFDDHHPLKLTKCTNVDPCLYYTTPVLKLRNLELLLFGEVSKFVPMSSKRVTFIDVSNKDVVLGFVGMANEKLKFCFSFASVANCVTVQLSALGKAELSIRTSIEKKFPHFQ